METAARLCLFDPVGKEEARADHTTPARSRADPREWGADLQLASHELDIRGAGNLLRDEQFGHIREVGLEL